VNNLKFGVLACGLLGLISVFLPMVSVAGFSASLWDAREVDAANVYMVMAGFAAALVGGALAVAKPPMQRWHSIVALVGLALVLVKVRDGLPFDIFKGAIGSKLMGLSLYAGLALSIATLAKPEGGK
jgi:hypothetical protein